MLSKEFNLSTLRALELFAPLTDTELEFLRPQLAVRSVSIGDVLMEAGTPGDELYILLVGEVKVIQGFRTPLETVVATLQPIAVFGEMALLTGELRSATVVATARISSSPGWRRRRRRPTRRMIGTSSTEIVRRGKNGHVC